MRITAVGHRRRVGRRAVRHHRLHASPSTTRTASPIPVNLRHTVRGARSATEFGCRAMGSGIGAARPAGLRRRPQRHAVRRVDGAVAGGAGEPEPDADRADTDRGDADGVGARAPGPESRRPGQPSPARRGPSATPTRSTCWVRRTPPPTAIPRTAWTAPQRVVQHRTPPTLDAEAARPHRGRRTADHTEFLGAACTSDAGGHRPRRRPAGAPARPATAETQTLSPAAARHRHRQAVAAATGTTSSTAPHWASISSSRPGWPRSRRWTPGASRSPPPTPPATVHGRSTCRAGADRSSAWRDSSCRPRSPPPSARCSTASPCRPSRAGPEPIALPAGQQELLISPGAAFVVDGVQLAGPLASQLHTAATVPAIQRATWSADHRELRRSAVSGVTGAGGAREHQSRAGRRVRRTAPR